MMTASMLCPHPLLRLYSPVASSDRHDVSAHSSTATTGGMHISVKSHTTVRRRSNHFIHLSKDSFFSCDMVHSITGNCFVIAPSYPHVTPSHHAQFPRCLTRFYSLTRLRNTTPPVLMRVGVDVDGTTFLSKLRRSKPLRNLSRNLRNSTKVIHIPCRLIVVGDKSRESVYR